MSGNQDEFDSKYQAALRALQHDSQQSIINMVFPIDPVDRSEDGKIKMGPQEAGVKHDSGKPPMSLLSGAALTEVAKVLEFGAKKYAAHNWKGGFAWSRLASAALRHLFAWIGGEDKDPETGLSHLAHCSCCLMFLLDFEVNALGTDDRYKKDK